MTCRSEPGRLGGRALILAGLAALAPLPALGHAALLQAEAAQAIRLHATYDTGEPMAEAQVIIYAPDNPAQPWSRGTTDAEGRYLFAPDPGLPGRWTVQVRQAGHGAVANVEVGPDGGDAPVLSVTGGGMETGPLQRAVMVALVVWGALGTALYFRRRRAGDASA
jgi:nickel transport protein